MNSVAIGIVMFGAIMVLLCCAILVFHHEYDDGLIGRAGLVLIAFVGAQRILKLVDDIPDYIGPNILILWIGLTLFIGRHTYRFLARATWKPPTWYTRNSGKSFRLFRKPSQ